MRDDRHKLMVTLLRREICGPKGFAALQLIDLHRDDGRLRPLCFYADPPDVADRPEIAIDRVASTLARAFGHVGSGAECLFKTVAALQALDIHDPDLRQRQHHVAGYIRKPDFAAGTWPDALAKCRARVRHLFFK